jgi:hypothetical protein
VAERSDDTAFRQVQPLLSVQKRRGATLPAQSKITTSFATIGAHFVMGLECPPNIAATAKSSSSSSSEPSEFEDEDEDEDERDNSAVCRPIFHF